MRRDLALKTATATALALLLAVAVGYSQNAVPPGTEVRVKLLQFVSSETSQPGDVVWLEVARDVVARGVVVIAQGTPVLGSIASAKAQRISMPFWTVNGSSPGRLVLKIRETTSIAGDIVPLDGPVGLSDRQLPSRPIIRYYFEGQTFDTLVLGR